MNHKLAIFASGSGTNAENIIRYFSGNKEVEISLLLTNNPLAGVIKRAAGLNVPCIVFSKHEFYNTSVVSDILNKYQIDFIVLAGFLLLIPEKIIKAYPDRIINIHPALLPDFGGKGMYGNRVHEAVLQNKQTVTGITIHFVNELYDEGTIIFNAKCAIDPGKETAEEIAAKVHQLEYKHYPEIIEQVLTQLK